MNNPLRAKVGLMASAVPMMSYLACTSVLASMAADFPGTSLQTVLLITYAANLMTIVTSLVIGKFTPYFTKRKILIVTGLTYPICGLIIHFYHPSVLFILVFTTLMGIGTGARTTCTAGLICDCFEGSTQQRLLGAQGAFLSVGSMIFVWLGSFLGKDNWADAYLAFAFVFVTVIIEILCLPEGKLDKKKGRNEKKDPIPLSVILYTILVICTACFVAVFNSNISMLVSIRGIGGTVEAGYATTLYSFFGIFAAIATGFVIGKTKKFTFTIGIAFGLVGVIATFFAYSVPMICLGGILCGISFSTVPPAGNVYAAADASDYNRSLCLGILNSGNSFGMLVSSTFIGTLLGSMSADAKIANAFLVSTAGLAVTLILSLIFIWIMNRRDLNE